MTPAKEAIIRAAAERMARASLRLKYLREMNVSTEPDAYVKQQQDYRVALAEVREAESEVDRVSDARFQPPSPTTTPGE